MYKKLNAPISVQWEVTDKCNFKCIHCYNYWCHGTENNPNECKKALWEKTVSEIINNNVFHVIVTGGEPLLVFNDLIPYIKILTDKGISVSINSNVSMLTKKMADSLKEVKVSSFLVSLPCVNSMVNEQITNCKGAAEATINGIRILIQAAIPFSVNMVVTKINKNYIIESAKQLVTMGVKSFSATKSATPSNSKGFIRYRLSKEEFKKMLYDLLYIKQEFNLKVFSLEAYPLCSFEDEVLLSNFKDRHCTGGKIICSIGFDGKIRPCSHSDMNYGFIDEGLSCAWDAMDDWRGNTYLPLECSKCNKKYVCNGGCKVEAVVQTGSYSKPDPYANCNYLFDDNITEKTNENIDEDTVYIFLDKVRHRPEKFGGILFYSIQKWSAISTEFYQLFLEHKPISVNKLISKLKITKEEATIVINNLLKNKIIKQGGVENE